MVLGREAELTSIARFLERIRDEHRVVIIEGEPGIGKSTLWNETCNRAATAGMRVLKTRAAEPERGLSYVVLGDLLEPVVNEVRATLPPPQARALEASLGRAASKLAVDERLVGMATLSALQRLAAEAPVVIAVDDAQWIDSASSRALAFAARRLSRERVGLLIAHRPARALALGADDHSDRIVLGPLSRSTLHGVINEQLGVALLPGVLRRIHAVSEGNPFFALEIARALASDHRLLGPTDELPIPATLNEVLAARLGRLSPASRELLVAAAAVAAPSVELLERYDEELPTRELLEPVLRRGVLVGPHGALRFAHPLLRSFVYERASVASRRRAHRRLAEISDDPEQRVRHLALAVRGPDARVADDLAVAAESALARGAPASAAELFELASERTPDDAENLAHERGLAAAEAHFTTGEMERAKALALEIEPTADGALRARVLRLLGKIEYHENAATAAQTLERAAVLADDPALRAEIFLDLAFARLMGDGPLGVTEPRRGAVQAAEAAARPDLLAEALALDALERFFTGDGLDRRLLDAALELEDPDRKSPLQIRPTHIAGLLLTLAGEHEESIQHLERLHAHCVEHGEESHLPMLLATLARAECFAGSIPEAYAHAEEALVVAERVGSDAMRAVALNIRAVVDCYAGDADAAIPGAKRALALHSAVGWFSLPWPLHALAMLFLSLDRPDVVPRAVGQLEELFGRMERSEPGIFDFVPDAVEAHVALGQLDQAGDLLARFERDARRLDRGWAMAAAARAASQLHAARGELAAAEESSRLAVELADPAAPLDRARALLVRGQLERRLNRRKSAQGTLSEALAVFDRIGSARWADRTRAELARLGLRRRGGSELTPTEAEVVQHAGTGLTNREIAAALFISPKTVEANLSRAYRKLGISSRAELGRWLAEREASVAAEADS